MSITSILTSLLGISKVLWAFLLPLLAKHTIVVLEAILPIAIEAVRNLESSGKSNAAKRAEAAKYVATVAKAEGIKAAEGLVNISVELAVQKLRAEEEKKPAQPTNPPTP